MHRHLIGHLGVVFERAVIDTGGQADGDQTPVWEVNRSERRHLLPPVALDAVNTVAN